MSAPTSARMLAADSSLMPGILCSRRNASPRARSSIRRRIESLNLLVEELQMAQRVTNQEALVIREAMAGDGCFDLGDLYAGLLLASSAI